MNSGLEGNTVIDTGPLIEVLEGSKRGRYLKEELQRGRLKAFTGELNVAELRYLSCRKVGWNRASQVVQDLLGSEYFRVLPSNDFLEEAAQMKCARSLSLVDCVTISMGKVLGLPVLFSIHEEELDKEIRKKAFETKIQFLESLL